MNTTCLSLLLSVVVVYANITHDFTIANTLLPYEDGAMANGYYNGVITIFGGWDHPTSIIEYDIAEESVTLSPQPLPFAVGSHPDNINLYQNNHYWVQNEANVYIIDTAGTRLDMYDLSTQTLTDNFANIPKPTYDDACIAHAHHILYVMGGHDSSVVQRYDISSQQWLSAKSMLVTRGEFSCVYAASSDALYAIGGWADVAYHVIHTVEFVTVSGIESSAFQYTPDTLAVGLSGLFSVVYGTHVYMLGGWNSINVDSIHVLDTNSNSITLSPHKLAYPVSHTSGILAENVIYLFGGLLEDEPAEVHLDEWQFYDLSNVEVTSTQYAIKETVVIAPASAATNYQSTIVLAIFVLVPLAIILGLLVVCFKSVKKENELRKIRKNEEKSVELEARKKQPANAASPNVHVFSAVGSGNTPQHPYLQWNGQEFLYWIMTLNSGRYACYENVFSITFSEHQMCGAFIPSLTDEWWQTLGVDDCTHRLELMEAVSYYLVGRNLVENRVNPQMQMQQVHSSSDISVKDDHDDVVAEPQTTGNQNIANDEFVVRGDDERKNAVATPSH